jgi:hypothetical protein
MQVRKLIGQEDLCDGALVDLDSLDRYGARVRRALPRTRGQRKHQKEKDMIGRKSIIALVALCALVVSAVSVASASAGATAYTCSKEAAVKDKVGAHCLESGGEKLWGHVAFTGATAITGTNAETAPNEKGETTKLPSTSILAGSLSGVATELQCGGLSGEGTMENKTIETSPGVFTMVAHGTGILNYTTCAVTKPAGKGCKVKESKVTTNSLTAISEGPGTLAFKPAAGETFASITIEGCSVGALNNTFPVTGSLKGTVTGATTTTTEEGVTGQGNLKFGGNKAGLGGSLTIKGPNGNGLVLTAG